MRKTAVLMCLLARFGTASLSANGPDPASPGAAILTEKMDRIIFPSIQFEDATLNEAVEYLRIKSRDLDSQETRTKRKGVNVVVRNADDKRSGPLVSLDLKAVPLKAALVRITELTGCTYRVEDQEVVVESRAFQGRREPRVPPAKTTPRVPAKIKLSIQVAELPELQETALPQREDVPRMKPKPGKPAFEVYAVLTEPQRQAVLRGLAQRKHLTLHTPDSKIVPNESTSSFPLKGDLSTMQVSVEADSGHPALDALMEFSESANNRKVSIEASLWSGQTVLLTRSISDDSGHSRSLFVFISATLLDAEGKPWVKSVKP